MAETRRGQNPGEGAGSQAEGTGSKILHKAQDVAAGVSQRAGEAVSALGSGMSSLGSTIREKAPQSGVLGSAASGVASGLQSTGDYLQRHGVGDMLGDLTNVIRRHPFPALLVGFGLGFMLARVTSRG